MNLYRIRELRLARAWSQEQLAELCSLNVRTIQRIENGEQASLETLSAIAAVMDLKVSELYRADSPKPKTRQPRLSINGLLTHVVLLRMRWIFAAIVAGGDPLFCAIRYQLVYFTGLYLGLVGRLGTKYSIGFESNKYVLIG